MNSILSKAGLVLSIVLMLLISIDLSQAQWSNDLNENTEVSPFTGLPTLVSDGQNGVIVFSQSRDVNPLLRAQRIDVNGNLRWPGLQGVRVSSAIHDQWIRPLFHSNPRFVFPDGEGGGYIAYQVGRIIGREEEPPDNIYAISVFLQRIDSASNRLFGDEGLRLMPVLPDTFQFTQQIMNMIPDGEGGVHVLWTMTSMDSTQFNGIYHNRIDKDGEMRWATQRLSDRALLITYIPYLDVNRNLNLYEYPGETRPPIPDRFIKVDSHTGNVISAKEIEIGVGQSGFNSFYHHALSDNGSAIFVFNDFRGDTLRAQKLDGDGNKLWGEEPIIVGENLFTRNSFEVHSDFEGGAYIWFKTDSVLYVTHVSRQGKSTWKKEFGPEKLGDFVRRISRADWRPMTVGKDGSVFVLTDGFQCVTKIAISGEVLWETRISNRASIAAGIDNFTALADADGGGIVAWEEVGEFVGIRAQRVDRYGNLGGTTPVGESPRPPLPENFILEPPYPNPFNDTVKIAFSIPETSTISLKVYDILAREVITLKQDRLFGGSHAVIWDGADQLGRKLSSGIYLLVLRSGQVSVNQKLLLLK